MPTAGSKTVARPMRIPLTLQAVFLASNRGKDVHKPPPQSVAFRTFFRNFLFSKQPGSKKDLKRKGLFGRGGKGDDDEKKEELAPTGLKATHSVSRENLANAVDLSEPEPKVTSPQEFFDNALRERGYSTKTYKTLQTAYHNKPTDLQLASYDVYLISLVRNVEVETFASIMECGISPNPCNAYGESILHLVCRRGHADLLAIMIKNGCNLQIADDYGRTPLHDACWAAQPSFATVEIILQHDLRLFHMLDARGSLPLVYAKKDHWPAWIEFFKNNMDKYWPKRNVEKDGEEEPPELTLQGPNTMPIPDPPNALTPQLASMVASGRMEPEEAQFLKYDQNDDKTCEESDEEEEEDDDDDEDFDDDDDSDDEDGSDFSFEEEEMAELLNSLATPGVRTD